MFNRIARSASIYTSSAFRSAVVIKSPATSVYTNQQRYFWSKLVKFSLGAANSVHGACPTETPSKVTTMTTLLNTQFTPSHLEIEDVSGGCGAFFKVTIVSDVFKGKATLSRHRLVQSVLKQDIADMHGITLNTYTPEQFAEMKETS